MSAAHRLIVFSGLKHSGKSTLARLVAQRLGLPMLDLDQIIAVMAAAELPGMESLDHAACVRQLYREHGKASFQAYEARAAISVSTDASSGLRLLALGGGTMENPAAMGAFGPESLVIFLDAPCDLLFERIMRGGLPAFLDPADPEDSFRQIYARRRSLALEMADHVVSLGNKSIEQSYDTIIPRIKEFIHGR